MPTSLVATPSSITINPDDLTPVFIDSGTGVVTNGACGGCALPSGDYVVKFALWDGINAYSNLVEWDFTANGTDWYEIDYDDPIVPDLPDEVLGRAWVSFNGGSFQHLTDDSFNAYETGVYLDNNQDYDSVPVPSVVNNLYTTSFAVDVTWSGGDAPPNIPYIVTSDQYWALIPNDTGSTPDTTNIDIITDPIGTANITIKATSVGVIDHGTIAFPDTGPNSANFDTTPVVFSPIDNSGFSTINHNDVSDFPQSWLCKIDRSTNTLIYTVQLTANTSSADYYAVTSATTSSAPCIVVSLDGIHIYISYRGQISNVVNWRLEKRLASNGSLVSTSTIFPNIGPNIDLEISTVSGVEYVAASLVGRQSGFDQFANLALIRTSDMATIFNIEQVAPIFGATMPLTFDASGNIWWITLTTLVQPNRTITKVTVPGGISSDIVVPELEFTAEQLSFDPYDNSLIYWNFNTPTLKFDISSGSPIFVNSTPYSGSSGTSFSGNASLGSPRFINNAHWILPRSTSLVKDDTSNINASIPIFDIDSNFFYIMSMDNMDTNPHLSPTIDATIWGYTPQGVSTSWEWFDIAIPEDAIVITEEQGTTDIEAHIIGVGTLEVDLCQKVQIINGSFQDNEGNPLDHGILVMRLNQDEQIICGGQVSSGVKVTVPLDENGDVLGIQTVWANDILAPSGSFYIVTAYSNSGQLAWGPSPRYVLSPSPFNLDTW